MTEFLKDIKYKSPASVCYVYVLDTVGMEQVSSSPPPFASHYYSINAPYSSTKLFVLLLNSSIGFIGATADGKKEGA